MRGLELSHDLGELIRGYLPNVDAEAQRAGQRNVFLFRVCTTTDTPCCFLAKQRHASTPLPQQMLHGLASTAHQPEST